MTGFAFELDIAMRILGAAQGEREYQPDGGGEYDEKPDSLHGRLRFW